MAGKGEPKTRVVVRNRRARFEYEILESFEAGIALLGPEVKALREGKGNLADAYATIRGGECFLRNFHISPYEQAGRENPEPRRERRLLMHRREIARLAGQVRERGTTLVPLSVYFNEEGRAKVEIGADTVELPVQDLFPQTGPFARQRQAGQRRPRPAERAKPQKDRPIPRRSPHSAGARSSREAVLKTPPGGQVYVIPFHKRATLIRFSHDKDEAIVQAGAFEMQIPISDIEPVRERK